MTLDLSAQQLASTLSQVGERALLYEVAVNPKPGLVDPVSAGPHPDMTVFTFIDSATSLREYLHRCALAGQRFEQTEGELPELFGQLRRLGQHAEQMMFETTNGVNTHKGAIFSLGVLAAATAQQLTVNDKYATNEVIAITKQMLQGLTENDFKKIKATSPASLTAGERQFLKYGKAGIRGEAEAGFPTVVELALPFLRQRQGTTMERLLDTLMRIAGNTDDSNLIKRAGDAKITDWMHVQSNHYFELGGSRTSAGQVFLKQLNEIFLSRNLSLGGSADLLILTIYFALLEGQLC